MQKRTFGLQKLLSKARIFPLSRVQSTTVRNITAEQVIENNPGFKFPCVYSADGCGFFGRKSNGLEYHEKRCRFRSVACPMKAGLIHICKSSYPLAKLNDHLTMATTKNVRFNGKLPFQHVRRLADPLTVENGQWPLYIYSIDGNMFIFKSIMSAGVLYSWVQVLADKRVADMYTVDISVSHKGTTLLEEGNVFSIDLTEKDLLRKTQGILCFGKAIAKKLSVQETAIERKVKTYIRLKLTISKVKEEGMLEKLEKLERLSAKIENI